MLIGVHPSVSAVKRSYRVHHMRLTKTEKDAITSVIAVFDSQAKVNLFGSRVDDIKRTRIWRSQHVS